MQTSPELLHLRGPPVADVADAMAFLRREWPFAHHAPQQAPVALLSQLYFLLPERTRVDREVAAMQRAGHVRVMQLFAGKEASERGVVRADDYEDSIRACMPPEQEEAAEAPEKGAVAAAAAAASHQPPAPVARPSSLPTASAAAASAAAAALPAKSHSNSGSGVFESWPSSDSAPARPASSPTTRSALPPLAPAAAAGSGSAIAATAASAPASTGASAERAPLRRKRSQPTPAVIPLATSGSPLSTLSARSASEGQPVKRAKAEAHAANDAAAASASSSAVASSLPPSFSSHTSGVNPKLHVNLSDTAVDDRFPALARSHESHFTSHDARVLLSLFISELLPAVSEVSVTKERLLELVYTPHVRRFVSLSAEQSVSCLLHHGLLLSRSADSFYLALPCASRLLHALRMGRKEITQAVRKRSYKEMPLRELLQVRLKTTPCRIEFHLRDMLGSEQQLRMEHTTMGPLIKLAGDDK